MKETKVKSPPGIDVGELLTESETVFATLEKLRQGLSRPRDEFADWEVFHQSRVQLGKEIPGALRAVWKLMQRAHDCLLPFDFHHPDQPRAFITRLETDVVALLAPEPDGLYDVYPAMTALRGLLLDALRILNGQLSSESSTKTGEDLTPAQFAESISQSEATLAKWRTVGKGPRYFKISGRRIVYPASEVQSWLQSRLQGGNSNADQKTRRPVALSVLGAGPGAHGKHRLGRHRLKQECGEGYR